MKPRRCWIVEFRGMTGRWRVHAAYFKASRALEIVKRAKKSGSWRGYAVTDARLVSADVTRRRVLS